MVMAATRLSWMVSPSNADCSWAFMVLESYVAVAVLLALPDEVPNEIYTCTDMELWSFLPSVDGLNYRLCVGNNQQVRRSQEGNLQRGQ